MNNGSVLEVSETTLIKLLMESNIPQYFYVGFTKILRFRFLTVTITALKIDCGLV